MRSTISHHDVSMQLRYGHLVEHQRLLVLDVRRGERVHGVVAEAIVDVSGRVDDGQAERWSSP